jgi:hypothetical protein
MRCSFVRLTKNACYDERRRKEQNFGENYSFLMRCPVVRSIEDIYFGNRGKVE